MIAVLAGVLVYGAVHLLGMAANHESLTLFLCVLGSVTFMSVVTALTTWNNKVGAFISLILLLLQLASSAGTYPLALTNRFFQTIHPLLPMSYTVSGLRETISLSGQIGGQVTLPYPSFGLVYWSRNDGLSTSKDGRRLSFLYLKFHVKQSPLLNRERAFLS